MGKDDIQTLTDRLIEFRDLRDWRQFHSLKDLIVSLNLEASELLELKTAFQAKSRSATEFDPWRSGRAPCDHTARFLVMLRFQILKVGFLREIPSTPAKL